MPDGATADDHLQQLLRDLSPEQRGVLIARLERGLLRGEEVPGCDLVLRALRRIIHQSGETAPRIGNAARLFFTALEPFMVDDAASCVHPGRIARCALDPIWTWIRRELMPDEAAAFCNAAGEALLAGDRRTAMTLTHAFQDQCVTHLEAVLATVQSDERARWRFLAKINTPRAAEDIEVLLRVLAGRDRLAALARTLPGHIGNLSNGTLAAAKAAVAFAVRNRPQLHPYALLIVMDRLAAPWQIVRLAIEAAQSDAAARVGGTPYGVAVVIVLNELERLHRELKHQFSGGLRFSIAGLLKVVTDTVRGLRTELALPIDSLWGRQFAATRTLISNLLKSQLELVPARVKRLLRARSSQEIVNGSVLDPIELAEADVLVDLAVACRTFAREVALNEISARIDTELKQYLDTVSHALLDGLRHAGEGDRKFRQSQVDAAIRFSGKILGRDYATGLSRAAALAADQTSGERRAARI